VRGLLESVKSYKKQSAGIEQGRSALHQMEETVRKNPADFQAAFNLASTYLSLQKTDRAVQVPGKCGWDQPAVRARAHQGSLTDRTRAARERLLEVAVANVQAFLDGKPQNVVN